MQRTIHLTLKSIILSFWAHQALGQFCDLYWLHHDQLCYKYFEEGTIYSEAEANCISHGANLTDTLPEELEDLFLGSSKQNETHAIWCNTEHNHDLDGTTEADISSTAPSLLFHINKRRRRSTTRCCIINSNKTFEEKPCDEERRYICVLNSMSLPQNCSEKTTSKNSRRANWEEARRQCQCEGSDLYSFKDDLDIAQFSTYTATTNESIWIGLRRENESHVFRWSDGSIVTGNVSNTVKLQLKDDEFCVAYVTNTSTWEAIDCNLDLLFLCKTQAKPTPVTTESIESTTSTTTTTESTESTAPPTTTTTESTESTATPRNTTLESTDSTTPPTTTTSESTESSPPPTTTNAESTESAATSRSPNLESIASATSPTIARTESTENTAPPTTTTTESTESTASPRNTTLESTDSATPPTTTNAESTESAATSRSTTLESTDSATSPTIARTESTENTASPRNTTLESSDSANTSRSTTLESIDSATPPTTTISESTESSNPPTNTSTKPTESITPSTTSTMESISSSPLNTSDVTDSPIIPPGIVAVTAGDERDRDSSTFGIVIASLLSVCALGALVIYAIKRKGRRGSLTIPAP